MVDRGEVTSTSLCITVRNYYVLFFVWRFGRFLACLVAGEGVGIVGVAWAAGDDDGDIRITMSSLGSCSAGPGCAGGGWVLQTSSGGPWLSGVVSGASGVGSGLLLFTRVL